MKKYKFLSLLVVLAIGISCTDDLNINSNPLSATEINPNLLFPQIQIAVSQQRTIELNGINMNAQHWTSGGSAGVFINPEQNIISPNTTNNVWVGCYTTSLRNLQQVRILTERNIPNSDNIIGQARVFEAFTYLNLTLVFGDIPFSEAIQVDEFPNPNFDDQLSVLRGIVDLADEGISLLQTDTNIVESADLIYGGDRTKWIKFANSIKLKALMLLENNDASVQSEIAAVMSSGDLIADNADNAYLPYSDNIGNENPLWKTLDQFGGGNNIFWYSNSTLVDLMNEKEDPRRTVYLDTIDGGTYVGQDTGVLTSADISRVSLNIFRRDLEDRLATAADNWFYIAEARLKGYVSGDAQAAFVEAVQQSLDSYDGQPGEIDADAKDAYIADLPDLGSLSPADALEELHEQKYVALFTRGIETWTHWRRTKVPEFDEPVGNAINGIIRRYQVPLSEQAANPNFPGVEQLDTPMAFE